MIHVRALLLTGCSVALLAGCQSQEPQAPAATAPATEAARPTLDVTGSSLDREGLLIAALRAGSAKALGLDDTARQRELDGRPFEFRIRFGCPAASLAGEVGQWQFDERRRVLRITVKPDLTSPEQLPATELPSFEHVEGFWIRQPWLLAADCPVEPAVADAAATGTPAAPLKESAAAVDSGAKPGVGIVQFYGAADARTHRRKDRAYETTKTLPPDQPPSREGYDFVLTGRLKALPDGRVITCAATSPAHSPRCVVSAQFDRVYLQAPGSAAVLAEWSAS